MDSTVQSELYQNQNPPPPPPEENPNHPQPPPPTEPYSSHFQYYPSQNPISGLALSHEFYVNPPLDTALAPPGVDSYYPLAHLSYDAHSTVPYGHHQNQAVAPAGFYSDPNSQNWVAKEVVLQFGADPSIYGGAGISITPNGMEQLAAADLNPTIWTKPTLQANGINWKNRPKKTKIVQSAYCGICKVDCNSKDVLEQHKLGKKHKKNLEKLKESIAPAPTVAQALPQSNNPVIGPQENPEKGKAAGGKKSRKKAPEVPAVDLETKRRKILEGGAAAEAVRTCLICNVVCNSDTVFSYHIAGQKHAAMVKKHLAGTGVANV